MTQPGINQFTQTPIEGQVDLNFPGNTTTCQADAAVVTALAQGQAVKLATTAGGVPKVIALAANTDYAFGFVAYNVKDVSYAAFSYLEVAVDNAVIWLTAGGAITRGANVEYDVATKRVIASAGVNPTVGFAYDTAANAGDLIRVWVKTQRSGAVFSSVQTAIVTATLAEINAGKTLIAGQTGKKITVTNITERVSGNFATGTAVLVQSSNGTPVVVQTLAEAGLTNGAVLNPTSANVTNGAGFAAQLGTSDGLVVANSGSAQTGGTSITFTITYQQA